MSNFTIWVGSNGRQHINISEYAKNIIELDMKRFDDNHKTNWKSGFINTIITNYHEDFPLSPNSALKNLEVFKSLNTENLNTNLIDKLTAAIYKNLINEFSLKYPNEYSFKIQINQKNIEILDSIEYADLFYDYVPRGAVVGFYIKIIIESYARLKKQEREKIYFKELIDTIENAIKNRQYIRFKANNNYIKVIPESVYFPKNNNKLQFTYLVLDAQGVNNEEISSAIKDLRKQNLRSLKEKFPLKVYNNIKSLAESSKTFLDRASQKPLKNFVVKFTEGGLNRFIYEEDLIPIIGTKDKTKDNIYYFKATETEIFLYLFKFGAQAEILEPKDARENFKMLYKHAYETYK